MIVFSTARLVYEAVVAGNEQVLMDLRRIAGVDLRWTPQNPQDICSKILHVSRFVMPVVPHVHWVNYPMLISMT